MADGDWVAEDALKLEVLACFDAHFLEFVGPGFDGVISVGNGESPEVGYDARCDHGVTDHSSSLLAVLKCFALPCLLLATEPFDQFFCSFQLHLALIDLGFEILLLLLCLGVISLEFAKEIKHFLECCLLLIEDIFSILEFALCLAKLFPLGLDDEERIEGIDDSSDPLREVAGSLACIEDLLLLE